MKQTEEIKELKAKNSKELIKEIQESEKKLTDLRFKAQFRKVKNYQEIGSLRKRIARSWTILSERAGQEVESAEK